MPRPNNYEALLSTMMETRPLASRITVARSLNALLDSPAWGHAVEMKASEYHDGSCSFAQQIERNAVLDAADWLDAHARGGAARALRNEYLGDVNPVAPRSQEGRSPVPVSASPCNRGGCFREANHPGGHWPPESTDRPYADLARQFIEYGDSPSAHSIRDETGAIRGGEREP